MTSIGASKSTLFVAEFCNVAIRGSGYKIKVVLTNTHSTAQLNAVTRFIGESAIAVSSLS